MSELDPGSIAGVGVDRRPWLRRHALFGLGACGGLVVLLTLAFGFTFNVELFTFAMLAGLGGFGAFVALVAAGAASPPKLAACRVEIEPGALRVMAPRMEVFPFANVSQGWWEEPDLVHLAMKNGEVLVVKVESAAEGDRLLRAAGVTAAERVLRVPLVSAASQIPGGSLLGGIVLALFGLALFAGFVVLAALAREMINTVTAMRLGGFSLAVLAATLLSLAMYALVSALRRREAVVGTDGIVYRRTLSTDVIPYRSLASVELDTRGVRLVRKDRAKILLPTRRSADPPLPLAPSSTPARTGAEAQRRVLVERIAAAMAASGEIGLSQVALDRLDRNGRSREAWQGDLGKLLSAEGDYRNARITVEDLGAVIEDAAAPADRRVGAVVALAAHDRDDARRRVRIAVQATADDDLRGALEAAAEGEIADAPLARTKARQVL